MAKSRYMIVAAASVVIVRDGKRIPIAPGGGAEFTEEEIASINGAVPGALRPAVNERPVAVTASDDDDDDDDGDDGADDGADAGEDRKPAKPAKAKKPAAKKAAKADDDEDI